MYHAQYNLHELISVISLLSVDVCMILDIMVHLLCSLHCH